MALSVGNIANDPALESPISVAGADSYHALRGNVAWAALTLDVKEQLLRKAGDYLKDVYGGVWSATVIAMLTVPTAMAQAAAELALIGKTTPLVPNMTRGKKKVKIGPLEVEYDPVATTANLFIIATRKLTAVLSRTSGVMVKVTRC
jgi:hypothetical protein